MSSKTSFLRWVRSRDALLTKSGLETSMTREEAKVTKEWEIEKLHRRLGHPGRGRFRMVLQMLGYSTDMKLEEPCQVCIEVKK